MKYAILAACILLFVFSLAVLFGCSILVSILGGFVLIAFSFELAYTVTLAIRDDGYVNDIYCWAHIFLSFSIIMLTAKAMKGLCV